MSETVSVRERPVWCPNLEKSRKRHDWEKSVSKHLKIERITFEKQGAE